MLEMLPTYEQRKADTASLEYPQSVLRYVHLTAHRRGVRSKFSSIAKAITAAIR